MQGKMSDGDRAITERKRLLRVSMFFSLEHTHTHREWGKGVTHC